MPAKEITRLAPSTTVIVRSSGERTTGACVHLLEQMFSRQQLIMIREVPFSRAVREGFVKGLDAGRDWTLVIDADVLVRKLSLFEMLAFAKTLPEAAFVIQGLVLDKVFGVLRPAGNHLYRTCHLERAVSQIPLEGDTLRPESATIDTMADQGFLFYQKPFIVGLHDFEQHHYDLFKKSFVHARKHQYLIKDLLPYWLKAAKSDTDYLTIILGARAGNDFEGDVFIDKDYLDRVCNGFFNESMVPSKPQLSVDDYDDVSIDRLVSAALSGDHCITMQESVFPENRRDCVFGNVPEPVETTVTGQPKLTFVANDPDQLNGPNIWLQRILPEFVKRGFCVQAIFIVPIVGPSQAAAGLRRQGVECLFLEKKLTTEEIIRDLLTAIKKSPPDVFVPNLSVPAYYAARWVKAARIPTIGIIRSDDTFHHELVEHFVSGELVYRLSGVVCKSRFLERYVQSHNPAGLPTLCSASGTWLPPRMAAASNDTLDIVFTGRLVQRQKKIFDVVHALKRVVTEVPGCRARVYGDDREGGKVLKMIAELALGEKLAYGGVIPIEEIYSTIQAHHVFVLLSDYEGMSTSLMEAMASGLVPICTRTRSGALEIISHNENGLLVDDRGDAVVEAIRRLKEEDGLWQRLSRAARSTIEARYTVGKGAERWTRFMQGLIQSTGRRRSLEPPDLHDIELPPLKVSENGLSREDVRMPRLTNNFRKAPDPFLNPPLSPENMDLYTIRSSILNALKTFMPRCQGTLLDVGCGQMPYRAIIAPLVDAYLGLDIVNPDYQQSVKPDLIWDGESIAMQSDSIDCALATELFEHLSDPLSVFKEILRVLKPGGELFLTVPFLWPLHDVPYDEYRYTPFSLQRHLKNAGFSNIVIKPLGGWNASLAQMIGLWLNRSGLSKHDRRKYTDHLYPLYRTLIESDRTDFEFTSQTMFTGLCGTAAKPPDGRQDCRRALLEVPAKKNPVFRHDKNDKAQAQGNQCLAIFTPCLGATSETFITNHIKYLVPGKTVVVTGRVANGNRFESPVKCIPFTDDPSRYTPEIEAEVLEFLQENRATHILCEYGCAGTEMVILNDQVMHLPIYVHFHGYDVSQELRKPKTVRYYQWMGDHVTGIITDTSIQKKRLVEIGVAESNIHIIPYGVKIPTVSAKPAADPCRFICVSRLVAKKAPISLLKAFRQARQVQPEITLDLVGTGRLMEEVRSFVNSERLQSAVTLHGAIDNEDVISLMRQSSVYVQHSVTDPVSGDAEGLPVAILEAAAVGLPVVSTLHEGIPDEVEHGETGYLVKEFNVDAMAEHMAQLAGDQALRKSMGAAARKKIQNGFTLEREIDSLRKLMGLSGIFIGRDETGVLGLHK